MARLYFDEFKLSELKKNTGWWANKFGYQLGVKYPDAFGITILMFSWNKPGKSIYLFTFRQCCKLHALQPAFCTSAGCKL